jgi:hypothetical protein
MRGKEIIEEIDFLKSQGEGRQRIFTVLSDASVKPESLRVLLRRNGREDIRDFLFPVEPFEPVTHDHGHHMRYHAGCRCGLCKEANRERMLKLRRELRDRPKDPADPRHGTTGFYRNHGCRCAKCSEAHSAACAITYEARKRRNAA